MDCHFMAKFFTFFSVLSFKFTVEWNQSTFSSSAATLDYCTGIVLLWQVATGKLRAPLAICAGKNHVTSSVSWRTYNNVFAVFNTWSTSAKQSSIFHHVSISYPPRMAEGFLCGCQAGPSAWNSLPEVLRDPAVGRDSYTRLLKMFLFAMYLCI